MNAKLLTFVLVFFFSIFILYNFSFSSKNFDNSISAGENNLEATTFAHDIDNMLTSGNNNYAAEFPLNFYASASFGNRLISLTQKSSNIFIDKIEIRLNEYKHPTIDEKEKILKENKHPVIDNFRKIRQKNMNDMEYYHNQANFYSNIWFLLKTLLIVFSALSSLILIFTDSLKAHKFVAALTILILIIPGIDHNFSITKQFNICSYTVSKLDDLLLKYENKLTGIYDERFANRKRIIKKIIDINTSYVSDYKEVIPLRQLEPFENTNIIKK